MEDGGPILGSDDLHHKWVFSPLLVTNSNTKNNFKEFQIFRVIKSNAEVATLVQSKVPLQEGSYLPQKRETLKTLFDFFW